jgi:hypothetical protein
LLGLQFQQPYAFWRKMRKSVDKVGASAYPSLVAGKSARECTESPMTETQTSPGRRFSIYLREPYRKHLQLLAAKKGHSSVSRAIQELIWENATPAQRKLLSPEAEAGS